jgi:hypothetical protein
MLIDLQKLSELIASSDNKLSQNVNDNLRHW